MQNQQMNDQAAAPNVLKEGGKIDADAILAEMKIDPQVQPLFDKAMIHGMRMMFDQSAFKQTAEYLNQPGDMAKKVADGVVAVVVMLWKRSNQTLNPKIIVPVTFALTVKGFEFLQESGNKEATPEMLGRAIEMATTTIMQKFGVDEAKLDQIAQQQGGQQPEQPAQPGILESANG